MGWAAIISALLSVFGPILIKWIQEWLASRMSEIAASGSLPDIAGLSETDAKVAMLDAVLADLPRHARVRKALIKRMRATVLAHADGSPVTAAELDEVRGLSDAANGE